MLGTVLGILALLMLAVAIVAFTVYRDPAAYRALARKKRRARGTAEIPDPEADREAARSALLAAAVALLLALLLGALAVVVP